MIYRKNTVILGNSKYCTLKYDHNNAHTHVTGSNLTQKFVSKCKKINKLKNFFFPNIVNYLQGVRAVTVISVRFV